MGKGSKQKTVQVPAALTPQEVDLREMLMQRIQGMVTEAAPARSMALGRLGAMDRPVELDPRVAGILSVMAPQISEAQGGMKDLFESLTGRRNVGESDSAVMAPYARFLDVIKGPDTTTQDSKVTMSSMIQELQKRMMEALQQRLTPVPPPAPVAAPDPLAAPD